MGGLGLAVMIMLCLAMEAFFSGSEVALISVDMSRIRRRAEEGSSAARIVQRIMAHPEKMLSTTLTGTNLSVVTASFLANELIAARLGPEASAWAIVMLIPLILLFGEILPKTLSRRHAETIALRAAWPLQGAMVLFSPLVALFSGTVRFVFRLFRAKADRDPFVTKDELRMILQAEHRLAIEKDEARLVRRLLDFADARASGHMTPLVDVVALPRESSFQDAARIMHQRGLSRVPIYTDSVDNITGVIEAMNLIDAPTGGGSLEPLIKKPYYVPENARIDQLLEEFRNNQQEMAIVVDEYGSAVGLLTLEDIVEQIVGDVFDEFDPPVRAGLERQGESLLVNGKVKVNELEEALGLELPRAGYDTVAGFVAHLFQKVPREGETLVHDKLRITVIDASPRAVKQVKFEILRPAPQ